MEDIIDVDYMHSKKVCTEFEITNLGQYHDLYLESDTLLLPGFFFEKCVLKKLSLRSCNISSTA